MKKQAVNLFIRHIQLRIKTKQLSSFYWSISSNKRDIFLGIMCAVSSESSEVKSNKARYDRVFYLGGNNSLSMSCIRFLIDFRFIFHRRGRHG